MNIISEGHLWILPQILFLEGYSYKMSILCHIMVSLLVSDLEDFAYRQWATIPLRICSGVENW